MKNDANRIEFSGRVIQLFPHKNPELSIRATGLVLAQSFELQIADNFVYKSDAIIIVRFYGELAEKVTASIKEDDILLVTGTLAGAVYDGDNINYIIADSYKFLGRMGEGKHE